MNNSESKKRLIAIEKSKFFSSETQDALGFAIEKLSDAEYHDAQIPSPSWPTSDGVKLKKICLSNPCSLEIP